MSLVMRGIQKQFKNAETAILNNINLEIESGEFVCIVGPSGCGKSTLLNLVAGLEKPSSGELLLNGKPITGPGADRTVMFQEHALFPWLTVIENVKFGMNLAGISKQEQEERASYYLNMVHLQNYRDYPIHQLSGGMRQRTALARALTMNADLLLMDEPFSALDKQTSNQLREELQSIWSKTRNTILFITHSVEEAVYLADRVIVLSPVTHSIEDIIPIELCRPRQVYAPDFVNYRHRISGEVRREIAG